MIPTQTYGQFTYLVDFYVCLNIADAVSQYINFLQTRIGYLKFGIKKIFNDTCVACIFFLNIAAEVGKGTICFHSLSVVTLRSFRCNGPRQCPLASVTASVTVPVTVPSKSLTSFHDFSFQNGTLTIIIGMLF